MFRAGHGIATTLSDLPPDDRLRVFNAPPALYPARRSDTKEAHTVQFVEEVALRLARETLELVKQTDDDTIVDKVADALGASSQLAEENFMTAVRVLRAEDRAQKLLQSIAAKSAPRPAPPPARPAAAPQPKQQPQRPAIAQQPKRPAIEQKRAD